MDPEGNIQGIDAWLQASGFGNEPADSSEQQVSDSNATPDSSPDPGASNPPDPNNVPTPQVRKMKIKVQGQELEVPETELVALAQMGLDYTQKTQRLAERERTLAPLEGVVKQIQNDPALRQVILDYWNSGRPTIPQAPVKPAVDPTKANDPVELLKAEILAQIRNELVPEMQQYTARTVQQAVTTGVQPLQQEVAIAQTMQKVMSDPLFTQVQQSLGNMVRSLPPEIGQKVFTELDSNPDVYMKTYLQHRGQIAAKLQASGQQPPPGDGQPKQIKHAPLLEASGGAQPPSGQLDRKAKSAKAKALALKSGDVNALSEWLQSSGALDHIKLDEE
jgi:hypothetical protein